MTNDTFRLFSYCFHEQTQLTSDKIEYLFPIFFRRRKAINPYFLHQ